MFFNIWKAPSWSQLASKNDVSPIDQHNYEALHVCLTAE